MRLQLILPVVKPKEFKPPERCANPKCKREHFIPFQEVRKNLRDTVYEQVTAWRYRCTSCGCTFRVYPAGVQAAHVSQRLKGMAVMLYLLGLSYGAVALNPEFPYRLASVEEVLAIKPELRSTE